MKDIHNPSHEELIEVLSSLKAKLSFYEDNVIVIDGNEPAKVGDVVVTVTKLYTGNGNFEDDYFIRKLTESNMKEYSEYHINKIIFRDNKPVLIKKGK